MKVPVIYLDRKNSNNSDRQNIKKRKKKRYSHQIQASIGYTLRSTGDELVKISL